MSDFLTEALADDGVVSRDVTIAGNTGTVFFRRISAGEKRKLLAGMKVNHQIGKDGTVEIDMGQNEGQRHLWVLYSVCDENGKRRFSRIQDVEALPDSKLQPLADAAMAVNQDGDDLGKS